MVKTGEMRIGEVRIGGGDEVNIGKNVEEEGCPKINPNEYCCENVRLKNLTANKKAHGRNEDDVVIVGGGEVNIAKGCLKINNMEASSLRIGGGSEVNSAMNDGDEDTECAKVNNVGATRACSDIDIVTNMTICSITLARTVRDSVKSRTEPGLSRSRSSTMCSPLRGTRRPSTRTSTTICRRLSTLGRGASPSPS